MAAHDRSALTLCYIIVDQNWWANIEAIDTYSHEVVVSHRCVIFLPPKLFVSLYMCHMSKVEVE